MGATNEDKDKIFERQAADAKWHVNSLVEYVKITEERIGGSLEEPRVKALKGLLAAYRTLVEEFD
ncbi:hypothetical protein GWO18_04750, partial [Candidatus Bathyarchaeota archaeon]|nr:hypothetical protein [Candidatus Bathyarchaeota archaeon]